MAGKLAEKLTELGLLFRFGGDNDEEQLYFIESTKNRSELFELNREHLTNTLPAYVLAEILDLP